MKEKICVVLMVLALIGFGGLTVFALIHMPKEVSRHEFTTNVEVVDNYHKMAWRQPIKSGKTTTYIWHSAQWKTYVEYGGKRYYVDDKSTYDFCKDKMNKTVQAKMLRIIYDNDDVEYRLLEILR